MADIAVIGPGAIGGTVAVRLGQMPVHTVTICARSPVDRLVLETTDGQIWSEPKVLVSPDQGRPCSWIIIATKAHDAVLTAAWLPNLVKTETRVAVFQNGVEHTVRFADYVQKEQIVQVIVSMPVTRVGIGHFQQRQRGHLIVPMGPDGDNLAKLFLGTGIDVSKTVDFNTEAWKKLALNCAGSVSALLLKPASVSHNLKIAAIMMKLVQECILVGRAEGAVLDDYLIQEVLNSYRNGPQDAINSLHADRLAGRPLEIDARNGAVVRLGRKHGLPTPVNEMLFDLLEAAAPSVATPV